jgi:alpha-mannosidase
MSLKRERDILVLGLFFILFLIAVRIGSADENKKEAVPGLKNPSAYTAHLVGHAHIDLSWLWRWEETVHEIAVHTFQGTLAQMRKMPGLTFAQSQPAVYEAIEKLHPPLFEEIRSMVRKGTWVPVGGMWAEPDLNMPDGESLARQLLYGKRYFLEKFGADVTVGWSPDSFGHSWQLPQILREAGIGYYVFGRCAPENAPVFWWEGRDGSKVLSYVPQGWYNYNLKNGLSDIFRAAAGKTPAMDFMVLYGEGDHGGGPRDGDVEAYIRFRKDKSQPKMEFAVPGTYFRKLESSGLQFPTVAKELNFAFPACYTTQASTKKNNRKAESLLLAAEKFSALAVTSGYRDYYPERDLDEAWKIVLRNQFHDILDGSSIGPVYDEVQKFYDEAFERGERALDFSLETIAGAIDTRGEGVPLVVFNSLFWERTEPVTAEIDLGPTPSAIRLLDPAGKEVPVQIIGRIEKEGRTFTRVVFIAPAVPSFGYKIFRALAAGSPVDVASSLKASPTVLENEYFKIVLDERTGWIRSLFDKRTGRETLAGPANVLQAIADEPESMSAWELGLKDKIADLGGDGAKIAVVERGPVRGVLRVRTSFKNSTFEQDIILYSGVARVDFALRLDWQERNVMIKASFPVDARDALAEFEIPYGTISRRADGIEVPSLKWVDVTDGSGNHGLSLLNDCKYGFDVKDNVLRMSIVHGATAPDPEADRGPQELGYALYPHPGSWKEAGTIRRGYEFNNPLIVRRVMAHTGILEPERSFIRVEPENAVLTAFKKETGYAERGLILRFCEAFGRTTEVRVLLPWAVAAENADLLERPVRGKKGPVGVSGDGLEVTLTLAPYEIRTVRVVRKPEN